jgi:hypothetical protein
VKLKCFFFCCEIRDVESGSGFNGLTAEEIKKEQKIEEALHASSLRVPRRYFMLFFILGMFGFCIIELDVMEFVFYHYILPYIIISNKLLGGTSWFNDWWGEISMKWNGMERRNGSIYVLQCLKTCEVWTLLRLGVFRC